MNTSDLEKDSRDDSGARQPLSGAEQGGLTMSAPRKKVSEINKRLCNLDDSESGPKRKLAHQVKLNRRYENRMISK